MSWRVMMPITLALAAAPVGQAASPTISADKDGNLNMKIAAGTQFVVDCPSANDTAARLNSCLAAAENATEKQAAAVAAAVAAGEQAAAAQSAQTKINFGTVVGLDSCGGRCAPISGGTVSVMAIGDLVPLVPNMYKCRFADPEGTEFVTPATVLAHTAGDHQHANLAPKYNVSCASPTYTLDAVTKAGLHDWNMTVQVHMPGKQLEYFSGDEKDYLLHFQTTGPQMTPPDDVEHLSKQKKDTLFEASFDIFDEDSDMKNVKVEAVSSNKSAVEVVKVDGDGETRKVVLRNKALAGYATITLTATDDHPSKRTTTASFGVEVVGTHIMPCKDLHSRGQGDGFVKIENRLGTEFRAYCKDGWTQLDKDQGFQISPCVASRGQGDWYKPPTQENCDSVYGDADNFPLWPAKADGDSESVIQVDDGFQKFVAHYEGDYEFTVYGARGGKDTASGRSIPGDGGVTTAIIKGVKEGTVFYFRVGLKGIDGGNARQRQCPSGDPSINNGVYARGGGRPWTYNGDRWDREFCGGFWHACGGFNGGGPTLACGDHGGASGGGGTDVRMCGLGPDKACDSLPGLDFRVLVAGGGGGSATEANTGNSAYDKRVGGHGGGGNQNGQGNRERDSSHQQSCNHGGTQTSGGRSWGGSCNSNRNQVRSHGSGDGQQGQGGNGGVNDAGGGGGGYWGGGGTSYNAGGSGGSGCFKCYPAWDEVDGLSDAIEETGRQLRGGNPRDHGWISIRIR